MITNIVEINAINRKLLDNYRVLDGRPIYRIVWSEIQMEVRKGKFSEFYGHIFLREYTAVKPIKKYWYFNKPCWVLEKLTFITGIQALKEMQEELVECRNGTYETVYPFRDKDEEPLPVAWPVVDLIIWHLQNPGKKLPSDWAAIEQQEEIEEEEYFYNQIRENERSPLFVWDDAAFVSTNQMKFKEEMTYKEPSKPIELV